MYRDRYRLSNSAHACESILQPPHSSSKPLGVGIAISLRPAILHHVVNIVIDPAEADMLAEAVAVFFFGFSISGDICRCSRIFLFVLF